MFIPSGPMDKYINFTELAKKEKEGKDYNIRYRYADSDLAVLAPHGGGIEPGTEDLADAIAAKEFLFYSFSGIKKSGNIALHLGSTRFDEPVGLEIVGRSFTAVTIHGCRDDNEIIYSGGKNLQLIRVISDRLTRAGFNILQDHDFGLNGKNDLNICNRCASGKGVQLEISQGLRKKMFDYSAVFSTGVRSEIFYVFVKSVRNALLAFDIKTMAAPDMFSNVDI